MKTRRGGDPTKLTVKTKREAYQPNVENQRKISEYESTVSKNKLMEDKYKSDVEAYGKQMKVYSEKNIEGRKDMTFFQGGSRYLNPQELDEYNKRKSEEYGGLKASKVLVSKEYGKNNTDTALKGEKGAYQGYLGATHEWFNKPTAPIKPILSKAEKPRLGVERMPLDKVTSINTAKKSLAMPENEKWVAPARPLVSVEKGFSTRGGKEKTNTPISKAVENVKRKVQYKQELKQGKAYFGRFEGLNASDISDVREGLKQEVKDIRVGASINKLEDIKTKRSMIKDVKSEIKQAKQASKYIKNLGSQYMASGAKAGESSIRMTSAGEFVDKGTGRIRFAKPEAFKDYRPSDDNPVNKNRTFGRKTR